MDNGKLMFKVIIVAIVNNFNPRKRKPIVCELGGNWWRGSTVNGANQGYTTGDLYY